MEEEPFGIKNSLQQINIAFSYKNYPLITEKVTTERNKAMRVDEKTLKNAFKDFERASRSGAEDGF